MKLKIIFAITFLLFAIQLNSQNKLSEAEKLTSLCKVWGFLKYYHPNASMGIYNWDQQLFKVLPKVEEATDKNKLSQIYLDWISELGEIPKCKTCSTTKEDYFNENFNLKWTENKNIFTDELIKKLKEIEINRNQGNNFYIAAADKIGNAVIQNEPDYPKFDWQNKDLRLLSLFRYWNIIEYFFPYKYQIDGSWDSALNDLLPKFLEAKSE